MKIIALGLPRDLSEIQLRELFEGYGAVSDTTLVMDANTAVSKGFGFVTMDDEAQAGEAIAALHGSVIGKQKIRVKQAEDK